ncbi:proline-rich receptor-like protein kinase PERK10 [Lathyrus oleraceus]|uniref:proline-rich receptor-like protein kinase PERK10 n=1 Tax=Pisum sativum TaxID=3888 RepID=UPI0021CFD83F|nr:proline-rich receptor-like protein kinase PERK10 [Pisum sativum]
MYYLDDLRKQGVDISDFTLYWLPEFPPDFMKRTREPSEKTKQKKRAKLGESSGSRPPVPMIGSPGKSVPLPPSVIIKAIAFSIPQPSPIYTNSETPPSTSRPSNQPSQKFNLATISLPISEAEMLNETTSPSSSSSPESPPYYTLSSDTEPSDPHSPTLAQLQHRAMASQQPTQSIPEPEVTSPPTENPNTTTFDPPPSEPIHYESQPLQPQNSEIPQPTTSADPQTPTLNLSPPTSPPQASEPESNLLTLEEAITFFPKASVDKVWVGPRFQQGNNMVFSDRSHNDWWPLYRAFGYEVSSSSLSMSWRVNQDFSVRENLSQILHDPFKRKWSQNEGIKNKS